MMNPLYPVAFNPEHYTVMGNPLIEAQQPLANHVSAKVIRFIITQIVKEDKDLKTYTVKITELADFLGINKKNVYRDMPNICADLMKQVIQVKQGNSAKDKWIMFHWVNTAYYDGKGTLVFRLSDELKPYITELEKFYTQYQIKEILPLKSFYSIRLYEILKKVDGETLDREYHEFTIERLRYIFQCEDKYKTTAVFLLKTVTKAIEEINEFTGLYVREEPVKANTKGNPIISVRFYVRWFKDLQAKRDYQEWHETRGKKLIEELK